MKAFVDDMVVAEAVEYGSEPKINSYLHAIHTKMKENKMVLNPNKCNVLIIDVSRNKSYENYKVYIDGMELKNVNSTKLLGVCIRKDLSWSDNIDFMYNKACSKLFILRKLKLHGFTPEQLKNMYVLHVRSLLEWIYIRTTKEYVCRILFFSCSNVNP